MDKEAKVVFNGNLITLDYPQNRYVFDLPKEKKQLFSLGELIAITTLIANLKNMKGTTRAFPLWQTNYN